MGKEFEKNALDRAAETNYSAGETAQPAKCFLCMNGGLSLDPWRQQRAGHRSMRADNAVLGGDRDKCILGAHRPASLTETVSSRFRDSVSFFKKVERLGVVAHTLIPGSRESGAAKSV